MIFSKQKQKNKLKIVATIVFVALIFCLSKITLAAPDNVINYQGKLTNTSDMAVADGNYNFTFAIYDAATGGNCLWVARGTCGTPTAKSVAVSKGIFNSALGEVGDNALTLDFNSNYWLSVKVGSDSEMDPRRRITVSGFAINSGKLNGQDASYYLNTSATTQTKTGGINLATSSGNVGIGTTNPVEKLHVYSANNAYVRLESAINQASGFQMYEDVSGVPYGFSLFYDGANTNDFLIQSAGGGALTTKVTIKRDTGNFGIGGDPGAAKLYVNGNVGIGTTSPATALHVADSGFGTAAIRVNYNKDIAGYYGQIKHTSTASGFTFDSVSAGSNAAPSFSFRRSIDSGISFNTSMYINYLGNVGIGTTNPQELLQVGDATENATNRKTLKFGVGGYAAPGAYNVNSNGDKITFYNGADFDGRFGISGVGDVWLKSVSTHTGAQTYGSINFWTGNGNSAMANRLSISGTGNIGIGGITLPLSKLDVNGGVAIGSYAGANAAPANGMIISGNVGIGTTGPTAYLHIKAGTTTVAPLKLTSGTNLTAVSAGAMEFDGTDLFFTPSATRETIAFMSDITSASHNPVTLAAIGSTPNAYGMTLNTQVLNLEPASASFGGVITTGTQTLAGAKTLTGTATFSNATYSALFTGGNVGIGTTSPGAKLEVSGGAIKMAAGSANSGLIFNGGTNRNYRINGGTGVMILTDNYQPFSPASQDDASFPSWYMTMGAGTGADYFKILRAPAGSTTLSELFNIQSDGDVIINSGNVGIGTTEPGAKLDVAGRAQVGVGVVAASPQLIVEGDGTSYNAQIALRRANSTSATGNIDWVGNTNVVGARIGVNDNVAGSMQFKLGGTGAVGDTKMIITSGGNVGIGTTGPTAYLHIKAGTTTVAPLKLTSGTNLTAVSAGAMEFDGTDLFFTPSATRETIAFMSDITSASHNPVTLAAIGSTPNAYGMTLNTQVLNLEPASASFGGVITTGTQTLAGAKTLTGTATFSNATYSALFTGGNVGIGTTSPTTLLHVRGTGAGWLPSSGTTPTNSVLTIQDSSAAQLYIGGYSSYGYWLQVANNTALGVTYPLFLNPNGGNVGIGTTSPGTMSNRINLRVAGGTYGGAISINSAAAGAAVFRQWWDSGATPVMNIDTSTANDLAFGVGGVEKMRIQTTSGNVGIGTTSPTNKLQIIGFNSQTMRLTAPTTGAGTSLIFADGGTPTHYNWITGANYNANDIFEITPSTAVGGTTFSTPSLVIKQNGNVGIGTTGPDHKLTVEGTGSSNTGVLGINVTGASAFQWATSEIAPNLTAGQNVIHMIGQAESTRNSGYIGFNYQSAGSTSNFLTFGLYSIDNVLNITGAGNVGIGTTSPTFGLDVKSTSGGNAFRVQHNGSVGDIELISSSTGGYVGLRDAAQAIKIVLDGRGTNNSYIANGGNVGIGTTSPGFKLDVTDDVRIQGDIWLNVADSVIGNPAGGSPRLRFNTGAIDTTGTGTFSIMTGNVGIGTTSPLQKLHVNGQCMTGDTLLPIRRRHRRKKSSADDEDFDPMLSKNDLDENDPEFDYLLCPIRDILPGDEVLSLNEGTNTTEYKKIKGLLDMGVKEIYEIKTKSGRVIRTTSTHPYLVKIPNSKSQIPNKFEIKITEIFKKFGQFFITNGRGESEIYRSREIAPLENRDMAEVEPMISEQGIQKKIAEITQSDTNLEKSSFEGNVLEVKCPYCQSANFVKRGLRKKKLETIQLYLCNDCRRTFTPKVIKGKRYPLSIILNAISLYNLGYSLEKVCKALGLIEKNKKSTYNADSLVSANLARNSELSPTYNTTRNEKFVKSQTVDNPLGRGDEGNRTPGLMSDNSESAPSHPHDKNIITQNTVEVKKESEIAASTVSNWIAQFAPLCRFLRFRDYAMRRFRIKDFMETITLAHRQLYRFRYHRAKMDMLGRDDFRHLRFKSLAEFLENVSSECPHQYFQEGLRASEAPLFFSKKEMIVRGKENYATRLAKFVLESVERNKDRHEALQKFMLINDSVTVATEVPVYLRAEDLTHMQTQLGFKLYSKPNRKKSKRPASDIASALSASPKGTKDVISAGTDAKRQENVGMETIVEVTPEELPRLITGHIDILQVRNGMIHILDYKPKAEKERPVEQLVLYALALSRLTGLRLFNFKCAWFDEKDYFEFYPLHAVYKPHRKKRKIQTIEGEYLMNRREDKFEMIRPRRGPPQLPP